MAAYINKPNDRYRVMFYEKSDKGNKVLGWFDTKKEAEAFRDKVNREWENKYGIDDKKIEAMARAHIEKYYTLQRIADEFNVPLSLVRKKLKAYKTDWYNYDLAQKIKARRMVRRSQRVKVDPLTASVYNTFIRTYKSLGLTEYQAWLKIYEITGETPLETW